MDKDNSSLSDEREPNKSVEYSDTSDNDAVKESAPRKQQAQRRVPRPKLVATKRSKLQTYNCKIKRLENHTNGAGTLLFTAPELFTCRTRPTKQSDIYSFAMYLLEILIPTRRDLWADDCRYADMIPTILEKKLQPSVPDAIDSPFRENVQLLEKLIQISWHGKTLQSPISRRTVADNQRPGFRQPGSTKLAS
eukprot:gene729-11_t